MHKLCIWRFFLLLICHNKKLGINTKTPSVYKNNTLAKQECFTLVDKADAPFSGAAISLLLDNIARMSLYIFVDLPKAFDTVCRRLLLDTLQSVGIIASVYDKMNVLEPDVNRLDYMKQVVPSEFCPQKEKQVDLFNNAFKLKHIAQTNPNVNSHIEKCC